jgi:hypothetical protein
MTDTTPSAQPGSRISRRIAGIAESATLAVDAKAKSRHPRRRRQGQGDEGGR